MGFFGGLWGLATTPGQGWGFNMAESPQGKVVRQIGSDAVVQSGLLVSRFGRAFIILLADFPVEGSLFAHSQACFLQLVRDMLRNGTCRTPDET